MHFEYDNVEWSLSLETFLKIPGKAIWYGPCLHYSIEGFIADMIEMY